MMITMMDGLKDWIKDEEWLLTMMIQIVRARRKIGESSKICMDEQMKRGMRREPDWPVPSQPLAFWCLELSSPLLLTWEGSHLLGRGLGSTNARE